MITISYRKGLVDPTFAEAAAVVVEQKRSGWRNPKHAQDWPASLERFVFPRFGQRSVSKVTSADVLGVLAPIWYEKPETARRVRHRIGAVLHWAVAMEYRPDNPCDRVAATLGRQRHVVRHMRALPHAEVAEAVATVRASGATATAKLAFEFLVLTAARSGEVRLARWDEIDLDAEVWTIPAERMKANREHRVPLSCRAAEILQAARALRNGSKLVFPSPRGKPSLRHDPVQAAQRARRAGRAARLPIQFPRLGVRRDEPPARGRRSGARPSGQGQGRSRVRAVEALRAPPPADG